MTNPQTLSEIGERGWLSLLEQTLRKHGKDLIVPIGDDATVRTVGDRCEILTSDALIEGTHFKKEWLNWRGLAYRSIFAAASDVAAMGGTPKGFLLSLGLPPETQVADLQSFADAIDELCSETGMVPYGGDTAKSERIMIDVVVIGEASPDQILRQTGAEPGDALWVTGWLGSSRAGWLAHEDRREREENIRERFWFPPRRWGILENLRSNLPIRAMTDLSDGLALDLKKILGDSSCGAEVQFDQLPIEDVIGQFCESRGIDSTEAAFLGGEDFELLVVEEGDSQPTDRLRVGEIPLTRIGRLTSNPGRIECRKGDRILDELPRSFEHFPSS